jgi:carboxypeptidase family protein
VSGCPKWHWMIILLAGAASALAASARTTFRGIITDPEGAAIRGARILVHWDPSGAAVGLKSNVGLKQDLTIETNERGEFVSDLPPGFYDVFVSAAGFTPYSSKVRLRPGEPATYKAKLKPDPLVARELGDTAPR